MFVAYYASSPSLSQSKDLKGICNLSTLALRRRPAREGCIHIYRCEGLFFPESILKPKDWLNGNLGGLARRCIQLGNPDRLPHPPGGRGPNTALPSRVQAQGEESTAGDEEPA